MREHVSNSINPAPLVSIEAEQALIGGLLLDSSRAQEIFAIASPEDFFRADHRIIYSVMTNLINNSEPLDAILVAEKASACAKAELLPYVTELAAAVAGVSNLTHYAKLVKNLSIARHTIEAAGRISDHIHKIDDLDAQEIINFAQSEIIKVANTLGEESAIASAPDALQRCIKELDRRMSSDEDFFGLGSGFPAIDQFTNGYGPGQLIILAGRPSMGKSTLALCMAAHMAIKQKKRGLFFTLEMPESQVMRKLLACVAAVNYSDLKNPKQVKDGTDFWSRVEAGARHIKSSDMLIIDCPGAHINRIAGIARRLHMRQPIDFIFVDHMHLVDADGRSEIEKLTQISNTSKRIARELKIPLIMLAQLNRSMEQRPDKRPNMSDIRGSGSIEQDADIIHFIYRDDYYNKEPSNPNAGLIEVDTAKQRDGELGVAVLENRYDQSRLVPTRRIITHEKKSRKLSYIDGL